MVCRVLSGLICPRFRRGQAPTCEERLLFSAQVPVLRPVAIAPRAVALATPLVASLDACRGDSFL